MNDDRYSLAAYVNRRRSSAMIHPEVNMPDGEDGLPWYCHASGVHRRTSVRSPSRSQSKQPILGPRHSQLKRARSSPRLQVMYNRNHQMMRDATATSLTVLFSNSNVPGLREFAMSDSYIRKVFWLIAFFALGILCLMDIQLLVSDYYSYPITVDVRLTESRKLQFPAVTICNMNVVRWSALCNSSVMVNVTIPPELKEKLCGFKVENRNASDFFDINDIDEVTSVMETTTMPTKSKAKGKKRPGNQRPKRQVKKNRNKGRPPTIELDPHEPEQLDLTERQEKEVQENLTTWLAVLANKDKYLAYQLGHQYEDLILRCTMKNANCSNPMNWHLEFSPTEGNCYTYKARKGSKSARNDDDSGIEGSGMNEVDIEQIRAEQEGYQNSRQALDETSLAGIDHGLELLINLQVSEYLTGTAEIGALVMIHAPNDFGVSASEAIYVSPERTTYIGLKMTSATRLPSPYPEHCDDFWPAALKGFLTLNATYSQQACLKICLQRTMLKSCGCQSAKLPSVDLNNSNSSTSRITICDTRRRDAFICVEKVMLTAENKFDDCDCPPRCKIVQYEKTTSSAKWPSRVERISFNYTNVAKVIVYFQTMTVQQTDQQSAWTTAKLFSSLGGFMGMYVGFSFLSLVEVFEILSRRLSFWLHRSKPHFKTVAKAVAATAGRLGGSRAPGMCS